MKRLVYIVMVIVLFLAGCVSATEQPTTVIMGTDTATPPPTSTKTLLSTATKRPSATPAIPTATITPSGTYSITPSPTRTAFFTMTIFDATVSITPPVESTALTRTKTILNETNTPGKPPIIKTTVVPTTKAPTTVVPTTKVPTTVAPTTKVPTTIIPTTKVPTTIVPTTIRPTITPIPGQSQCSDGVDNDQDGFTDWSNKGGDPQCQNKNDNDESQ